MSTPNQSGYQGSMTPASTAGEYNQLSFLIRSILGKANFSTLVQVVSCSNSGGVSPVGTVDVQPLVDQVDGLGNAVPHGVVFGLPYARIQGGTNAIIMDPQPGDIGIAIFADRDISGVKSKKARNVPTSGRRNSMSDGIYIGGTLNGTPSQYVQFNASGITIDSPTAAIINAPAATVNADTAEINATASASVTAPVINLGATGQSLQEVMNATAAGIFNSHTHPGDSGGTTGTPNQTIGATGLTSTVKAG